MNPSTNNPEITKRAMIRAGIHVSTLDQIEREFKEEPTIRPSIFSTSPLESEQKTNNGRKEKERSNGIKLPRSCFETDGGLLLAVGGFEKKGDSGNCDDSQG